MQFHLFFFLFFSWFLFVLDRDIHTPSWVMSNSIVVDFFSQLIIGIKQKQSGQALCAAFRKLKNQLLLCFSAERHPWLCTLGCVTR